MNFLKYMCNGQEHPLSRKKFRRFGLGTYEREEFIMKVTGKNITIQSGFDFGDVLFGIMARLVKEPVELSGAVITKDKSVSGKIEEAGLTIVSQRAGKYVVKGTVDASKLSDLFEEFKDYLVLFNLKSGNYTLKVKPSPPKPGSMKEKFATGRFELGDLDLLKQEFLFDIDVDKFKKILIKSRFIIENIETPKEFENDAVKARLNAIRNGKIIRDIDVDGNVTTTEHKFSV
jgi:hypothetical protein